MSSNGGPQQLANGRWISNGRKAALSCLDNLMGSQVNIQTLHIALQGEFDKDPVKFFKEMLMPLMPKAMLLPDSLDLDADQKALQLRNALAQMELATAPISGRTPSAGVDSTDLPSRM